MEYLGKKERKEEHHGEDTKEKERRGRFSEWEKRKESVVETEKESTERGATSIEQYWDELERFGKKKIQAGAELGQAQAKLELG